MSYVPAPVIVALDLETTGLDPRNNGIMEVAAVFLDRDSLQELAVFCQPVYPGAAELQRLVPGVRRMHEASELLASMPLAASCDQVMRELQSLLQAQCGRTGIRELTLLGSSVHFDRAFLRAHAPEILPYFHHRQLDVTALKLARGLRGLDPLPCERAPVDHRALPDARHSAQYLREWLIATL